MKKLAFLLALALELAVCGCGTTPPNPVITTSINGLWEARMLGGTGEASELGFTTTLIPENSGPLNISSFAFFNQGTCFDNGLNVVNVAGSANFTTNPGTDQVTGSLKLTVNSITPSGNVLTLISPDGGLTGISNGTTTTTGTLTNGVAVGTWTLSNNSNNAACQGAGSFIMCQGAATCTVP
jgi:hypothetical protein